MGLSKTDYPWVWDRAMNWTEWLAGGPYPITAPSTTANGGLVQNVNGYDIVFSSAAAGANRLSFEREKYVAATGEVDFWVKIPTLSHTAGTAIYMWYGNASTMADARLGE